MNRRGNICRLNGHHPCNEIRNESLVTKARDLLDF